MEVKILSKFSKIGHEMQDLKKNGSEVAGAGKGL